MAHQLSNSQFSSDQSININWAQSYDHFIGAQAGMSDMFQGLNTSISRQWPAGDSMFSSSKERTKQSMYTPRDHKILLQYQQQQQQGLLTNNSTIHHQPLLLFELRNCKYLSAAQEVLSEVCSLEEANNCKASKLSKAKMEELKEEEASLNLHSMDHLELHKTKAKLLSMLEEVDKRYRRYSDQMRGVVASFEAMAGEGAARVYSALAMKAMSRHFRCLRDGIVSQIRTLRRLMGEKEDNSVALGSTKGETPRLKRLDQCMRQHKAFQQGMMEQHPWRPQRGLPERSVSILRSWLFEHFLHPYPNDVDKQILARETGLSRSQVSNWFINARVRLWKPMVEEMYKEEMKDLQEDHSQNDQIILDQNDMNSNPNNPNPSSNPDLCLNEDHKPNVPLHDLLNIDSDDHECLSSIISPNSTSNNNINASLHQQHSFGHVSNNYDNFLYNNNAGNVSLTLGLQQHGSMNLMQSFSSNSNDHSSLLFTSDDVDHDGQQLQFNVLDGEPHSYLPYYRNFMGAQLLHDLAG